MHKNNSTDGNLLNPATRSKSAVGYLDMLNILLRERKYKQIKILLQADTLLFFQCILFQHNLHYMEPDIISTDIRHTAYTFSDFPEKKHLVKITQGVTETPSSTLFGSCPFPFSLEGGSERGRSGTVIYFF
jgi:hypothetical protein